MKLKTAADYDDSHSLVVLTALSIAMGIVLHRVFLLLAVVFAFVWPLKRLFDRAAGGTGSH